MIAKILALAKANPTIAIGTIVMVAFLAIIARDRILLNAAESRATEYANQIARSDSLRLVVQDTLSKVYERYAETSSAKIKADKNLEEYRRKTNLTIDALMKANEQVRIENEKIAGSYDSVSGQFWFPLDEPGFTLHATVTTRPPPPTLSVDLLLIPDTTTVAFVHGEDGLTRGLVQHTSRYIYDMGGTFIVDRKLIASVTGQKQSPLVGWGGLWIGAGRRLGDGVFASLGARFLFFEQVEFSPFVDNLGGISLGVNYRIF